MRRSFMGRLIPAAFTAAGVALPAASAAAVMLHAMIPGHAQSSLPGASGSTVAAVATPTPAPAATATPMRVPAATATPRPSTTSTRTIAGPVEYDRYGAVQATITVSGTRITNVSITAPQDSPRSASINQQAVPQLQSETLQAQSANVNVVSGATITSDAYIQSLQGALQSAGL